MIEDLRHHGWQVADAEYRRLALTSPLHMLPIGVPLALVHSTADQTVPIAAYEVFATAARAAGDRVTEHLIAGESHRSALDPRSATWRAVKSALAEQLDRVPA